MSSMMLQSVFPQRSCSFTWWEHGCLIAFSHVLPEYLGRVDLLFFCVRTGSIWTFEIFVSYCETNVHFV